MGIKAALCRLLLTEWGKTGQRIYQKRLPQRDGRITSQLPAVVVKLLSDHSIGNQCCGQQRQSARVQIEVFADEKCCEQLEPLKLTLDKYLSSYRGQVGFIAIQGIYTLNSYDLDLPELGLERKIIDYKVIYQRRAS